MSFLEDSSGIVVSTRDKLILSGLYLSKYDSAGLKKLGFDNFAEAFNVIGYALGSKPASIKNYRDEFDPLFPNGRKGWHKRATREYCLAVLQRYKNLDMDTFTRLVESFFSLNEGPEVSLEDVQNENETTSSFAQRLITGLAAERYFESIHRDIPQFKGLTIENTTRFGCGYDFKLQSKPRDENFLAVEVKGLRQQAGNLMMTPKEYCMAEMLRNRFFLFVVRNFRETPAHEFFQDPLHSSLQFRKVERVTIQVSWLTTI